MEAALFYFKHDNISHFTLPTNRVSPESDSPSEYRNDLQDLLLADYFVKISGLSILTV